MKFTFEVNTTTSKPVYLYFDERISLTDLHKQICIDIEYNTMLMCSDILDIFVQNQKDIMSLPASEETLKEYIERHPEYFNKWSGSLHKNIHKIYVMDKKYMDCIKENKPAPVYINIHNAHVKKENERNKENIFIGMLKTTIGAMYL